jgi:hypothetical protein
MDSAGAFQYTNRPLNIFGGSFTDVGRDVTNHYHIHGVNHEPEPERGESLSYRVDMQL